MVQKKLLTVTMLMLLVMALVQCTTPADTTEPSASTASDLASYENWDEVLADARGQTVNWYMWGGQDNINAWVTGYVADNLQEQYGITLNMVPVADTAEVVNKVLGEKEAGRDDDGSVDLIWINGENFFTMRQADLLYGPWSRNLPSTQYINWDDPSVAFDLGFAVDGYESPYGKAQFVMIYDSAQVPEPPTSFPALIDWIKANPGKFTYPAPPDFTGYAFMLQMCYHATGGHEQFLTDFDQALFDETWQACWDTLNEIEPFLWREGQTYPETHAQHDDLFANGEVWFNMAWNPSEASAKVAAGQFPESTRTFVFDTGTVANTHYVAIPYNSPHKAAAMVTADFILSPEAQVSKFDINNWGDLPAVDMALMNDEQRAAFDALPRGVATLPGDVLSRIRLPELSAQWRFAAESAWEEQVLNQ